MLQLKQPGSGKKFLAKTSFSDVLTNAVDSNFQILRTGAGQTVNQAAGNLNLVMGTTVNEETIIRSTDTFIGPMTLRYGLTLSQRIVNNNIFVELVDSVADTAAFNITSTTTVVVNVPATSMVNFSAKNIGQSMYISQLSGTGFAPQRGVIAAVNTLANTITFTVAGFPASGTGQCYLYGWNTYRILYDGATATTWKFDAQRNGWNSTDSSLTCQTTASPGHSGVLDILDGQVTLLDELLATSGGPTVFQRGRRATATPDGSVPLYIQLRVQNGTVAPASTTTATFAFITLEDYNPSNVVIEGVRPQGASAPLPVSISSVIPSLSVSRTISPTGYGVSSFHHLISAATTNATSVKAAGGTITDITLSNTSAAVKYFKLYNKLSAPTVGTDTPIMTVLIPAGSTVHLPFEVEHRLAAGIAYAITGGVAVADTTAVALNDVVVNIAYV